MTKHRPPLSDAQPPAPFTREQELRIVEILRDIVIQMARERAKRPVIDAEGDVDWAIHRAGFPDFAERGADDA